MSIYDFGERLQAQRKNKNLTQATFAERLGLAKVTVAGYEQGTKYPSLEVLINICTVLGCSADFLLGLSDEMSFKMGGLTDEQAQPLLQLIANMERTNALLDEKNDQSKSRQ